MRALLSEAPGGPETLRLREVPWPEPGRGEVRIRVAACGINYPDALIIADRYQAKPPRPFAPGTEVSGVVDALGPGTSNFSIGDRVFAVRTFGGLAEAIVVPSGSCFAVPPAMPDEDAASLLMTYGTSHHALKDRANLQPGERLLVLGAAGGVGLAAVELGRRMGATVVAAVSSEDKADVARSRGADATVLYPAGELSREAAKAFTEQVKRAAQGEIDVVLDPVGGDYAEPALRSLGWDGRFLVVGFPAGIPRVPLNLALLKGCHITGVFWGSFITRFPERHRANVAELLAWYGEGAIRPLISARYPLERGAEAIADLVSRRAIGKVVVTMTPAEG
jgi:NADPH:quinone reductase-like Zn-dependent oxidoreductase